MKKIKLLLMLLLIIPFGVYAKDYKVVSHVINAEMEIAGGLNVTEAIVVEGTTDFIPRTINYYSFGNTYWNGKDKVNFEGNEFYNGYSISKFKYGVYKYKGEIDLNKLDSSVKEYYSEYNIKKPSDKAYTYKDDEQGNVNLKLFYPVKDSKVVFYINYTIANAIVKHKDVKEMNYTFMNLDKYGKVPVIIRLITPYPVEEDDMDEFNVFVHGEQNGIFQYIENKDTKQIYGVYGEFKNTDVANLRVTLPQKYVGIDIYLNDSKENGLKKILKIEKERTSLTKQNENIKSIVFYVLISIMGVYVLGSLLFVKIKDYKIFALYLVLGLVLLTCNYLFFKFSYWYLYFVILVPVIMFILFKYLIKNRKEKKTKKRK